VATITVKVLGSGDAQLLDRVAPDVFDNPLVPLAARDFLSDPRHRLVVATDDELVIGFVSAVVYVHPDKPAPELWINEVGVAPTHQGQGIARRMIASALEAGRVAGCREAWVLTDASNRPAMRLYETCGGRASDGHVMFTFDLIDQDAGH
jgi:aminoglycoside 6'-N-acetyltransferase I